MVGKRAFEGKIEALGDFGKVISGGRVVEWPA
jgi:hypothetical protein